MHFRFLWLERLFAETHIADSHVSKIASRACDTSATVWDDRMCENRMCNKKEMGKRRCKKSAIRALSDGERTHAQKILNLVAVMLHVEGLEGDAIRNANGQVGNHGEHLVVAHIPES